MKLFVYWSGGKNCILALNRILQDKRYEVTHLLSIGCVADDHSRAHGLTTELVSLQASALGLEVMHPHSDYKSHEIHLKTAIHLLKKKGITGGVFGDVFEESHRDVIERICFEMDIIPIFPLWKNNSRDLLQELISLKFKAKVVSVNAQYMPESWLGREIDENFINEISRLKAIDPGAENGEYHTFVYDGPLFQMPVSIHHGPSYFKDNHWFLNLQ